jgi:hypothetical protein
VRVCSVQAARSLSGFATPSDLPEVSNFLVDDKYATSITITSIPGIEMSTIVSSTFALQAAP